MRTNSISWIFFRFVFSFAILVGNISSSKHHKIKGRKWEGSLAFQEDFDGFEVEKDHWTFEEACEGKGQGDTNTCFTTSDSNIRLWNGTLIITANHKPFTDLRLFATSKNFTSARLSTTGPGFSYGTFVISARLPAGKALTPSIWLRPAYKDHDNCKYEEIEIASARGEKSSNLIFSASFGRNWDRVARKRVEKAFPGVSFSEDFHEFALVWKSQPRRRLDWFVDGVKIFTASTHFYSDWILSDETNVPCSRDKSLFKQPLQLTLSMSVGGGGKYKENPLTLDDVNAWEKPTFEIDWVKVYQ